MTELCSYCHQDRMNCHCEQFHPNIVLPEGITLSKKESEELFRFILDCGYVSYEKWDGIHRLFDKLRKELGV